VEAAFARLEGDGHAALADEHVPEGARSTARSADLRYAGQEYTITVALPGGSFDAATLRRRFDDQYRQTYGHASPKAVAELVTLRVTASGVLAKPPPEPPAPAPRTPWDTRTVRFGGVPTETVIVPRDELAVGEKVEGPAIVEESTATTVVPPGWVATVVTGGHLTIVAAS
jgi:N-methylhydantoinase A